MPTECYDSGMTSIETTSFHDSELLALMDKLLSRAQQVRHRHMIVLAGNVAWCWDTGMRLVALSRLPRVTWVSSEQQQGTDVVSIGMAKKLLGQERDVIVFDAHSGFDPDAFGVVSGVVCGGGLLVLLCPPLVQWENINDPAAERIAIWPYNTEDISGRFLQRIVRVISASPEAVTVIEQGATLPVVPMSAKAQDSADIPGNVFRTDDQRAAVAAIEHVLHGHRRRPLVLVADRGRGKTAALGIAAARLLQTQAIHIVVTAPRLSAVQPLFQQVQKILPEASVREGCVQWGDASIQFIAPDVLCLSAVSADLVLVDEAAAIPATLLQQLLTRYSRLVFSTTTHGYEGTGRGFAVRFRQTLDEQTPGWNQITLHTPVRWAKNDPLEKLVFKMLLLDATSANDEQVGTATVDNVVMEKISQDALANNEFLLAQVFGLLVVAHYRTRPNDLRNLLDGPGLSVYVSRYQGQVVATALVATEGDFDAQIAEAVFAGQRRPRGHLLPQSLMVHAGLKDAAGLHCARVMRIAVHPVLQQKGLGRQLLKYIKDDAKEQGADLFGASFGATESLLHFWAHENILPVRMGFRRGHASGEYSVMVLTALSATGEKVYAAARSRFKRDLPQWLADPLQMLDVAVSAVLLQGTDVAEMALADQHDLDMLLGFSKGERTYEDVLAPVWRLLIATGKKPTGSFSNIEHRVLFTKVLQKQSWANVARRFGLTGKAEVLTHLRNGVRQLLDR